MIDAGTTGAQFSRHAADRPATRLCAAGHRGGGTAREEPRAAAACRSRILTGPAECGAGSARRPGVSTSRTATAVLRRTRLADGGVARHCRGDARSPAAVYREGRLGRDLHRRRPVTRRRLRPIPAFISKLCWPNYFSTMGIPIRRGRSFGDSDREGSVPVVIVTESLARRAWPGSIAVGKRLKFGATR